MTKPKPICAVDGCDKISVKKTYCCSHYKRYWRHGDPLAGRGYVGDGAKFVDFAVNSETDECINWPFFKMKAGHGTTHYNGARWLAHRLVLTLAKGDPPTPLHVAAHAPVICHNASCVNPRHLRWATKKENTTDMKLDGTYRRGNKVGGAKLLELDINPIRNDKRIYRVIAKSYGISIQTVCDIKKRRRWDWVE